MLRFRSVVFAFVFALATLLGTHLLKFPGSVGYLMERMNGEQMLDRQASHSSDEVYLRLERFGEANRALYLRTIVTVDFIFPLSFFVFLLLAARYVARPLQLFPAAYLLFDFLENSSVLLLLSRYPERLPGVATCVGYFTRAKSISMTVALVLPPLVWVGAKLLARFRSSGQKQKVPAAIS